MNPIDPHLRDMGRAVQPEMKEKNVSFHRICFKIGISRLQEFI